MKKFLIILEYELGNYIKNKSYMVTTLLVALLAGVIMFVPNFFDMSGMLGTSKEESSSGEQTEQQEPSDNGEQDIMLLLDRSGAFTDISVLKDAFPNVKWERADSEEQVKQEIEEEKAEAGFVVQSLTKYDYYVYNKGMMDTNRSTFEQVLTVAGQMKYCQEHGIDYAQISTAFSPQIESSTSVLGKDMTSNYWYCYGLVIIIFMIIIVYGVMVATSVTQEKSNRTIEVLVTSTDTNCLFFGKVFAGAIAALFQVGIIMGVVIAAYKVNQGAWGGMLDMIFDIPAEVLVAFAFFGLGGFLFYTFIYGAVGALVSKTEDINKSAGGVQMVIMIVYFVVLFQLMNVDGIAIKIASYLPISSYSAMFARVAMGNVAMWEVVLSFVILVVSTAAVGVIGAKIYRMGTLRYGNPIKLRNALKGLKQAE